jgi:hypothetical protein
MLVYISVENVWGNFFSDIDIDNELLILITS